MLWQSCHDALSIHAQTPNLFPPLPNFHEDYKINRCIGAWGGTVDISSHTLSAMPTQYPSQGLGHEHEALRERQ